jgi:dihydroorotate dehydrogenase
MGFPGKGAAFMTGNLKRVDLEALKRSNMVLGINIGKNKATPNEEAVLDYLELLQCFAPYAGYLAINISSPNTVGLRQLQGRGALEGLLTQLHAQRQFEEKKLNKRLPLLVKLAPDLSESELNDAIDVILGTHMDGVIVTNTTLERAGLCQSISVKQAG